MGQDKTPLNAFTNEEASNLKAFFELIIKWQNNEIYSDNTREYLDNDQY